MAARQFIVLLVAARAAASQLTSDALKVQIPGVLMAGSDAGIRAGLLRSCLRSDALLHVAEGSMTEVSLVLNSGAYSAIPRQDGSFVFHEVRDGCETCSYLMPLRLSPVPSVCHQVPEGSFLLEVYDTQRSWPSVRVEVGQALYGGASAVLVHKKQQLQLPMQLKPLLANPEFFEKRQGFQWSSIFMNPMMIMMAVTGVIMFVLPKMMANIDPEELKKMQDMQATQGSLSFSDLLNPDKLKEKQAQLEQKKSKKTK